MNRAVKDDYWILEDFTTSILKEKSIANFFNSHTAVCMDNLIINIIDDSVEYMGMFAGKRKIKKMSRGDTLFEIAHEGDFIYFRDTVSNAIYTMNTKEKHQSTKHYYRRITEQWMLDALRKPSVIDFWNAFNTFFVTNILSGTYINIKNNKDSLVMTREYTVNGLPPYNGFYFHNYFGSYHPYSGCDAIKFFDTTVSRIDSGVYNWVFQKDTLILTEMVLSDNLETYTLGRKKLIYLKK